MAQTSSEKTVPFVIDSPQIGEIFASEVIGTGVIGNFISINLGCHRLVVPEGGKEPVVARVVVARLILTGQATVQLATHLAQLSKAKRGPDAAKT